MPLSRYRSGVLFRSVNASQASRAIVLRTRPYGESDKIVTFLTEDAGKLTGIAKGAKNSRRRFANCLDPFTAVRAHFRIRPGAGLVFLESCDLLQPPGALIDPAKFAYGSYLIELIDQLTAEAQPIRELYCLLAEGLDALRQSTATSAFLRTFELRVLGHAGYAPQMEHCERCHEALDTGATAFFDPMHGSFICAHCRTPEAALVALHCETLTALGHLKELPLHQACEQRLGRPTADEAAQLLGRLLALHLPRPLRSVKLIAALR